MSAYFFRTRSLALGAFLAAASPLTMAQVTLNLGTAPAPLQVNCVATTDANGLSLGSDGTSLQATGVTFAGTGCVPPGAGSSDFNAALTPPAGSPVAGTSANVTWSATAAATQCVFAGSAPAGASLVGWPFGATACSGSACSGAHTTAVIPSASGSYTVGVVCTNSTGFAQGSFSASAPQLPPQPAGFTLNAPATATLGTPFAVSWNVTGATSCTGAASLAGSSVSLPGWTDTVSTTSPRNVTAAVAGAYTLTLACSNTAGTSTSVGAAIAVAVSGGGGACTTGPAGLTQLASGLVSYGNNPGMSATRDLTSFGEIWGFTLASQKSGTGVVWPGVSGSAPFIAALGRNQYIAAKFVVPVGVSQALSGSISHNVYGYGLDTTAVISPTCGDFTASAQCSASTPQGPFPFWWTSTAPSGHYCPLTPGTYYMNVRWTNPAQVTSTCAASATTCPLSTTNSF